MKHRPRGTGGILSALMLAQLAAVLAACAPGHTVDDAEEADSSASSTRVGAGAPLVPLCAPVRLEAPVEVSDSALQALPPPVLLAREELRAGNPLATYAAIRDREATYMAHPTWSRIYPEVRLNFEQFLGLPCAGLQAMALLNSAQSQDARIPGGYEARDALEVIAAQASRVRFVVWGEEHHLPQTRSLYEGLLRELRLRGYRYLAAETFAELPERRRGLSTAETGYYTLDPVFASAIRVATELGFEMVAYDPGGDVPDGATRDETMARRIVEQTIARDSTARVLVLAGRAHAAEVERGGWVPMALALQRLTGLDPFTVYAPAMTERLDPSHEHPMYRDATARGLVEAPRIFVDGVGECFDLAGPHCLLGSDAFDAYVFWPRVRLLEGRPDWMVLDLGRTPNEIPAGLLSGDGPWLIQAHRPGDPVEAVPLDQVLVSEPGSKPSLMLAPGEYHLRSIDRYGIVHGHATVVVPPLVD